MKKYSRARKIIIRALVFIVCFIVTNYFLDKVYTIDLQKDNTDVVNKVKNLCNLIWSFFVANGRDIWKIYSDCKENSQKTRSDVSILIKDVSCIRRTQSRSRLPEIILGNGEYFIYVTASLKNIGNNTVIYFYINEQQLEIEPLAKQHDSGFSFRVYRKRDEKLKSWYDFSIEFVDDKDACYQKDFRLNINEEKQTAKITATKTQRKRSWHRGVR